MAPLRVLLVAPNSRPSMGGVEMHISEVARRLPEHGVVAEILTVDVSGDLPTKDMMDGVHVRRVRGWPTGRDWRFAPGLVGLIRSAGADLVHVHSYQTFVPPLALAAARASRIPTVVTFHSGGHSSGWRRAIRPAQVLVLSPFLRSADALVAVSPFEASVFARRLRIAEARIDIIRNGADLPRPTSGLSAEPGLLLSIGRLEAYKGHRRAIEAVGIRAEADPGAHLLILGTGPEEAALRAIASDLGVDGRVKIASVPADDRQRYADTLARAEAVMVLSEYESQGIAAWRPPACDVRSSSRTRPPSPSWWNWDSRRASRPDADAVTVAAAVDDAVALAQHPRRLGCCGVVPAPTWDGAAAALARLYAPRGGVRPDGAGEADVPVERLELRLGSDVRHLRTMTPEYGGDRPARQPIPAPGGAMSRATSGSVVRDR
ncbi:MAG: glycosyltransferase family 4 protein [Candidatus Limnocylindrales bacterium]